MQVLPRLFSTPQEGGVYGLAGTIAPFIGAAMGGAVAGFAAIPRGGVIAGAASQAPAFPAFLETVSGYLGEGYLLDAVVITALLFSYVAITVFIAERVAGTSAATPRAAVWGLRALAALIAVCGLLLVTNPVASWLQAAFMFVGAGTLAFRRAGNY